jgi:1-aminocyclopropane-1-carboxylate deaminase/D-cysteine desulfhydrase-like pyridoxal-dependent ACC family enzyme
MHRPGIGRRTRFQAMTQIVRDPTTGLDRLVLSRLPTPLDPAPKLAVAIGLAQLSVKREDMSGYALGGNKLRQLDFILAEAMAAGADILVTTAGSQSNFCRSLAGAAAKLGLGCHLHLRAATGTALVGNLLLDEILGATVTFTQVTDPWDPQVARELAEIAEGYEREGKRPFIVQLTGVSASTAVAGWMSGAAELLRDAEASSGIPDAVISVCGSGLTLAGLALGFKHLSCPTRLIGISAQQPAGRLKTWIVAAAGEAAARLGLACRLEAEDFDIVDSEIGPGYGKPSTASIAAVRLAGRTEGLLLDPVYTGKGFAGLQAALHSGLVRPTDSVIFIHSGGTPGLFAHAPAFQTDRAA